MKRLIKYNSSYSEETFSDCSTNYEVLPFLVENDASSKDLRKLVNSLGLKTSGNCKKLTPSRFGGIQITHNVKLEETTNIGNKDVPVFLGFITIKDVEEIKIHETINNEVTSEIMNIAIDSQDFSIRDIIEIDNETRLLIESWEAFHHFRLSGYTDFDTMLENLDINDYIFDDSVFLCGGCYEWHYSDDCYSYNYKIIDGEIFGVSCGCADVEEKENYDNFINDSDQCISIEVATELVTSGEFQEIETFIGGMVDGRGGYINGKSVNEGVPSDILANLLVNDPEGQFVFAINEIGQFQTYFTVFQVIV